MTEPTAELVEVRSMPEIGLAHVELRAAGPAGAREVPLPGGLVAHLDVAQPGVVLAIGAGPAGHDRTPGLIPLVQVVYGETVAAALAAGEQVRVIESARHDERRARLVQLLASIAQLPALPPIAALDVARLAHDCADQEPDDDLRALLQATADRQAMAAVSALRALPAADDLDLDRDQRAELGAAVEYIRTAVGSDVSLGPISNEPWQFGAEERDSFHDQLEAFLRDVELATASSTAEARQRPPEDQLGTVFMLELEDLALPVDIEAAEVVVNEKGAPLLDLTVTMRIAPAPMDDPVTPPMWARVFDSAGTVLYMGAFRRIDTIGTVEAKLAAFGRYDHEFWLDVTGPRRPRPLLPAARSAEFAKAAGSQAARHERRRQWSAAADLWQICAGRWQRAGDAGNRTRSGIAWILAARALRQAGRTVDERWCFDQALNLGVDPLRWFGQSGEAVVSASPADSLPRLRWTAALTPAIDRWVARELESVRTGAAAALARLDLTSARFQDDVDRLVDGVSAVATPGEAVAVRARARLALARAAREQGKWPVASALVAASLLDWPELDPTEQDELRELARQVFERSELSEASESADQPAE